MTKKRQRRLTALLAVGGACVLAPAAQAATLQVDDNKVQCSNAGFDNIQSAVDAAKNGDTISVCAGNYVEGPGGAGTRGVTIQNKQLTIVGAGQSSVTVRPNGISVRSRPSSLRATR